MPQAVKGAERKGEGAKKRGTEIHLDGIGVSPGIAIGRVVLLAGDDVVVVPRTLAPADVGAEVARFRDALERARTDILRLRGAAAADVGDELARILDTHALLLSDESLVAETVRRIESGPAAAEAAFDEVIAGAIRMLLEKENEYFRDRAGDLRDVRRRVLRLLVGQSAGRAAPIKPNSVIVARDLTPSDAIALPHKKVAALLCDAGGKTSHTAILARSLGIPAVVGLQTATERLRDRDLVIVDGIRGAVYSRPSPETLRRYKKEERTFDRIERELTALSDLPAMTKDHHAFELTANVDLPGEVDVAAAKGARGIGLYRTEFLFLLKGTPPSEDEQAAVYSEAAARVAPDKVIFRTLDVGADKILPGMPTDEANPFLGLRGIRFSLREKPLFRSQLRAMLRASARRNVRIMLPMVSSLEEVAVARGVLEEAQSELRSEGIPFDENVELGIMIETPAAVVLADLLAREVDFFSIGTNDLIQYTIAVDRGNERVADLYDAFHPAVLRSIHRVVEVAVKSRIWVGLCGEMASDPLALLFLIGLGIDEISVSPFMVPHTKNVIRSVNFEDLRPLSRSLLKCSTAKEGRAVVTEFVRKRLPGLAIYL